MSLHRRGPSAPDAARAAGKRAIDSGGWLSDRRRHRNRAGPTAGFRADPLRRTAIQ
jgi:hypothetical protein